MTGSHHGNNPTLGVHHIAKQCYYLVYFSQILALFMIISKDSKRLHETGALMAMQRIKCVGSSGLRPRRAGIQTIVFSSHRRLETSVGAL